ncbi:DUF5692 family protein [Anaerocolumna sp. AGMB13025]|uniref:DUF5692 family protein n=1 Tax=Anaerocolumna sp. AGMB13025 TaxID=3039116 RepID=UPI00241D342E|nr:DUF5692 family protein [Anaerocolumna sp. AGMB13025]WFR56022.1 DUF5692 family protein [Anaerocolumna sp. AGMB13025]
MFVFYEGIPKLLVLLVCFCVFASLFLLNELGRRFKWVGFSFFVVLPVILTILWLTIFKKSAYMDWFHLAKVYSSTAGCIGFWCIRYVKGLSKNKIALCFPPFILAINILEAVLRDFEVGSYTIPVIEYANNQLQYYIGGVWNYMNGIAGILNIITITGWFGICIRRVTKKDRSQDMLWPDMLWFWIIAYDLWNFAYTYNCLPAHAWYCGVALLLAPTLCAFTLGKGAWLQHRAQTLAIWCMFAQTFPAFLDASQWRVLSAASHGILKAAIKQGLISENGYSLNIEPGIYKVTSAAPDTTALFIVSFLALLANLMVFIYMVIHIRKTKRNPYTAELYTDLAAYSRIKALQSLDDN